MGVAICHLTNDHSSFFSGYTYAIIEKEEVMSMYDEFLDGNIVIVEAISAFYANSTQARLSAVLEAIRQRDA